MRGFRALALPITVVVSACGPAATSPGPTVITDQAVDTPLRNCSATERDRFHEGDQLFDLPFRESDGLGPLYVRAKCGSCHAGAANGPGSVQKMVVVDSDGLTPAADQSALQWGNTERPFTSGGGQTPIAAPAGNVKVTQRLGPAVFGRGYLEAISDDEILRVEAEQAARTDGISGHPNRVTYNSRANPDQNYHAYVLGQTGLIGRFGLKARVATLDDFTADAFQGDMGMTTPMRPIELPNPDGLTDDGKPGIDLELAQVNAVADYLRLLEIPSRTTPDPAARALFDQVQCSACHVASMHTRTDWPIAALANIDAPVFTDLLLHDMGEALADGQRDGSATRREWKTAPLIGLRFLHSFLHDGRAETVAEAIAQHGGEGSEANGAVAAFAALSDDDQKLLIAFVKSL